ncbi:MAG: PASTA domain-containing protein, partial [Dehalococcoidia bacterium]
LGLNSAQLLPLFPVSDLDQPVMEPLPRLERPPVWSANWLVAGGVVGLLVFIIVLLYAFAGGGEGTPFAPTVLPTQEQATPAPAPASSERAQTALTQGGAVPDLSGQNVAQALDLLQQMGLAYFVLETFTDLAPPGVILAQSPSPGTPLDAGDVVTLVVSRGQR